jgi:Protein of unknown function (DUF1488)
VLDRFDPRPFLMESPVGQARPGDRFTATVFTATMFNWQVNLMQIIFPNEIPEYSGRELTLAFPAVVDGERVECMITAEALEDHFGAASPRLEDMLGAFDAHRPRIEAATRRLLAETGARCVLLRSGYVRFYEANWRA